MICRYIVLMPTTLLAVRRAPPVILRGLLANDKAHSHTLCYDGSWCLQPFSSITFQPFALNVNTHTCTACRWGVQSPHKPVQRRHDDGTAGAADGSTGRLPPPVTERTREGISDWAGVELCMHDFKASSFPLQQKWMWPVTQVQNDITAVKKIKCQPGCTLPEHLNSADTEQHQWLNNEGLGWHISLFQEVDVFLHTDVTVASCLWS